MFHVKDLSKSVNFYRYHLGACVKHEEPGLFVQLEIHQQPLRLVRHPDGGDTGQQNRGLQIDVSDLDYFTRRLGGTGASYRKWSEPRGVTALELCDPDNNRVVLIEKSII